MMRIQVLFCLFCVHFSFGELVPSLSAVYEENPDPNYKFERLEEVERECGFVIRDARKLKTDRNTQYTLRNQLQLMNGDWEQEDGKAPLMPYDVRDYGSTMSNNVSSLEYNPLNLTSFWVWNVDVTGSPKNTVSVSGLLELGMLMNGSLPTMTYATSSPHFEISPGRSLLLIQFEGIYVESKKNGGERVLCMLGSTLLPSRSTESSDPWTWLNATSPYYAEPPLTQDDNLLLVLHYPQNFTLASRAVRGEVKSLNRGSSTTFFDQVHLSSQLGAYANYQFGSEEYVSNACEPYPAKDELRSDDIFMYKGDGVCGILQRFSWGESLNVVPNWNCNGTDEYCSKLGPFTSGKLIRRSDIDGGFGNIKLTMQDVRCEPGDEGRNLKVAKVSAVFRALVPPEDASSASQRSGLNGMTLPAEGVWSAKDGQLCMVGCLENVRAAAPQCTSRICIYIPLSFSIRQRSIIVGSISSIDAASPAPYYPLSFERVVHPSELWNRFDNGNIKLSYQYTKVKLAGAFLERSEPFDFGKLIKKSLLKFPRKEDTDERVSVSYLTEDLTLHISALPDPFPNHHVTRTIVQLEILSLGSYFGDYWSGNWSVPDVSDAKDVKVPDELPEKQLLINVSAEISLLGQSYKNLSTIFLEGIYDPVIGKMYLIGCRDVRASRKTLFESRDLENGLDCLIEVKVEYPPTTSRWLVSPSAKISIASQRNEDDPLYFKLINLLTFPILYRRQREDIISRKGIESVLSIFTLSLVISCILSQIFYIRAKTEVVPFISLVMLIVQAIGYSIPLITGAEALFARLSSDSSYESESYNLKKFLTYQVLDYTVKLFVLVAFLLTLRLCQKVWKSRIRMLARAPLEPMRVPRDRRVAQICLAIHAVGFLIILIIHLVNSRNRPIQSESYLDSQGKIHKEHEWQTELKEYVGLIQDFFLLPQIIGNFIWQINGKPLRMFYYVGVTVVRIVPHIYDYVTTPVFNPYFSEEYEFVNPTLDFYSKFGDIAIPLAASLLAVVVYMQQRWSYEKLTEKVKIGQKKLLPLGSRVYERLPSARSFFEAELVSGVNDGVIDGSEP